MCFWWKFSVSAELEKIALRAPSYSVPNYANTMDEWDGIMEQLWAEREGLT